MSVAEITRELAALPGPERLQALRATLRELYPGSNTAVERFLRKLEHPSVPEAFWEGLEQAEDDKATEIGDEQFGCPPA